ncbi:tyrosine-type recombinase/integrase [Amycolatopsis vancoresmycina]|uniref:Integrase family protein n=1 Tax=Amycolatopsis vancoresmycina DSM 44592 TaxID=1292037 RepID=R1G9M2_9PSEU|nr:tyrosine-type recombinase/integrase [Amycolatopsis vancoresmycina]EOD68053.1 integrase family protein [Amycolatopsis vancoresmycina DSM 44592]
MREAVKAKVTRTAGAELTAHSLFEDVAAAWLAEHRKDAEMGVFSFTSVDNHWYNLKNHVLPVLAKLELIEVETPVINRLCQAKLKAHSLSLARQVRAVISNVITFAINEGLIKVNPVKDVAPLLERRAKKAKPRTLTTEELFDFLGKLDTDEEAIAADLPDLVRGFLATGERRGELLGADWPDFDEEAKELQVSGGLTQARGKGTTKNGGKTGNAERGIPLPDWYVVMLVDRRDRLGVINPTGPIHCNSRGGYLNFQNLTNRHWLPFRRRAGYEWVTFKTLRKTLATLLDEAGLTARQIADILGHAHPSMTQDVYMGRSQKSRAGADALGSLPLGKTGNKPATG